MKTISETKRAKMTGKGMPEAFVALRRSVVRSREFIELDPHAKSLFLYLASLYYGTNNGDLAAPNNRFKEAGFNSPDTLSRAKKELIRTGWAVITRQGMKRKATLYGLTIWPIDDCGGKLDVSSERVASHAWKTKSDIRLPLNKVYGSRTKAEKKAA